MKCLTSKSNCESRIWLGEGDCCRLKLQEPKATNKKPKRRIFREAVCELDRARLFTNGKSRPVSMRLNRKFPSQQSSSVEASSSAQRAPEWIDCPLLDRQSTIPSDSVPFLLTVFTLWADCRWLPPVAAGYLKNLSAGLRVSRPDHQRVPTDSTAIPAALTL